MVGYLNCPWPVSSGRGLILGSGRMFYCTDLPQMGTNAAILIDSAVDMIGLPALALVAFVALVWAARRFL